MPAYTYECQTCDEVFDVRRAMADDSPVVCMSCASQRVQQVYYVPAMVGRAASGTSGAMADANDAYTTGGGCCGGGGCGC